MIKNADGNYDKVVVDGLLKTTQSFESALQLSLFLDRRADSSEVSDPQRRCGWFGNEFDPVFDRQLGSKLWLLKQARITKETLLKAKLYTREALEWFVEDGHATKIQVDGSLLPSNIKIAVKIFRLNDLVVDKTLRFGKILFLFS
jgi:phage gp46-like protein